MNIIDGKKIAEEIEKKIAKEVFFYEKKPGLAIILVGNRTDSKIYVDLKEREAKKVDITTHIYKCSEKISEQELLEVVEFLNNDQEIDAILVQLPLPKKLNTDKIIAAIKPEKDVDGFHPENIKNLSLKKENIPPIFNVILKALENINFNITNKNICIIGNSEIFIKNLEKIFKELNAKVKSFNPDDKNLIEESKKADVLISAVGRPQFINKEMIKDNAVVIDIGITKTIDGKVYGDVDFTDIKDKKGYITPVPGGVGPMTIALALQNTLKLYKTKHKLK
jgi:methylenetetrahydrofolate dehydrogenase (NADP+)/methenyltetrahydrofolate cyclohydrolase